MARIRAEVESAIDKPIYNTDSLLDCATGSWVKDSNGQWIIVGGIDLTFAVIGKPNTFKSMVSNGLMIQMSQLYATKEYEPYALVYDTENSIKVARAVKLLSGFPAFTSDPIKNKTYHLINKATTVGEEYWKLLMDYRKAILKTKPIKHQHFKNVSEYPIASTFIDSFSELEFSSTVDAVLNQTKDDSSLNTNYMRDGLIKSRIVKQFSSIAYETNMRFILTVHIGKKSTMGESRFSKPTPELKFLKEDEALKGVTGKFSFLIFTMITTSNSTILKDPDRLPYYPIDENDTIETDLNLINLKTIRSKSGPSGVVVPMVCSQSRGLDIPLSNFIFLHKVNKGLGMSGSAQRFHLDLYPEVSLGRKQIASALKEDVKLRNAVLLTARLKQVATYTSEFAKIIIPTKEIYTKMNELGYDWDKILRARQYWVVNDSDYKQPYISIVDILEICAGIKELKKFKKGK